jgi:antirestriction protein ArdC
MKTKAEREAATRETAQRIIDQFREPRALPKAMAALFLRDIAARHSAAYSWGNQLIVMAMGHDDAGSYKHWQSVGRQVRRGEKSFLILKPITRKFTETNKRTGEEETRIVPVAFGTTPVFGIEQTDIVNPELWAQHDPANTATPRVFNQESARILRGIAEHWGLKLTAYNGTPHGPQGWYQDSTKTIALGVENVSTFAHELIHAAEYRTGALKPMQTATDRNARQRAEIVAELGGAVLLTMLGYQTQADIGGAWNYIDSWTGANGDPTKATRACLGVIDRVGRAVTLILDTAQEAQNAPQTTAATAAA